MAKAAKLALGETEVEMIAGLARTLWGRQGETTHRDSQGRTWLLRADRTPYPGLFVQVTVPAPPEDDGTLPPPAVVTSLVGQPQLGVEDPDEVLLKEVISRLDGEAQPPEAPARADKDDRDDKDDRHDHRHDDRHEKARR
jgi:hypothetical protein